jgi:prophage regulatory protein
MNQKVRIERKPEVLEKLGLSNTTLYIRIKDGLFPPPISLGGRAVGFLSHEIDSVFAGMVAGYSNDEIRTLVLALITDRETFLERARELR